MNAAVPDPLDGLDGDEIAHLERLAIQEESREAEQGRFKLYTAAPQERNIAAEVREYVETLSGEFTTRQVYSELGIIGHTDKATVRKALERLRGMLIERDGTRAGAYRVIANRLQEMDLENVCTEYLDLKLPFDLDRYVGILPGNVIVLVGGPDSGKTAFLFNVIKANIAKWDCHYFNSEMAPEELRMRLDKFEDFPRRHKHFHAYERSCDFADVIRTDKYTLNLIDFLELTDEFYKVSKYLSDIHRALEGAVAIVAIQPKTGSDLPLGGDRAMEKPRLVISLKAGNRNEPNRVTILKAKNRLTTHSLRGLVRSYKLVRGSVFIPDDRGWM